MKTGLILAILAVGLHSPGFPQERKDTGRERDPAATTSTRPKPASRQDVSDTPKSKPREVEKRKTSSSKPIRTDSGGSETNKSLKKQPKETRQATDSSPEVGSWDAGQSVEQQTSQTVRQDHQRVFEDVRRGLNSGNISSFSELLGPQVHVNLRGGESGYYSSSQAYYVLENYLRTNRFSGLQYGTMEQSGDTPFASGKVDLDQKGVKEAAQVYVSLTQAGGKWVISQIKIY